MNTTTTKPERKASTQRKPTGSGASWKSAIVAAGLTGVLFGWAILGRAEGVADSNATIEQTVTTFTPATTSIQAPVVNPVVSNLQGNNTSSQISIPALPQRPVFQQPVTRTRRS